MTRSVANNAALVDEQWRVSMAEAKKLKAWSAMKKGDSKNQGHPNYRHQPPCLVEVPNAAGGGRRFVMVKMKSTKRPDWRDPTDPSEEKNRLTGPMAESDVWPPGSNGRPTGLQDKSYHYPAPLYGA